MRFSNPAFIKYIETSGNEYLITPQAENLFKGNPGQVWSQGEGKLPCIGETKGTLCERFKEHRQATNNPLHANATAAVPSHFNQCKESSKAHVPNPWYGRYPTHAHNHITRAVAAMDSCFAPLVANQYGIAIARSWYVCFSAFFEHFNQPGHSIADKERIPLELQPTFSVSAVRQEKRTS